MLRAPMECFASHSGGSRKKYPAVSFSNATFIPDREACMPSLLCGIHAEIHFVFKVTHTIYLDLQIDACYTVPS